MRSLVPKENKSARSMLHFRLLVTADTFIRVLPNGKCFNKKFFHQFFYSN
jgi:hypothetical protein